MKLLRHPALQALALLALYVLARDWFWDPFSSLPRKVYASDSIILGGLGDPEVAPRLAGLVLLVVACRRWRWFELELSPWFQWCMGAMVFVQAWLVWGCPYNLFLDQAFVIDRLLLFALMFAAWWRPAFIPLVLAGGLLFLGQQAIQVSGLNWTERRLLVDLLMLFGFFLFLRRLMGTRVQEFLFVAFLCLGALYVVPALGKVALGPEPWSWAVENRLGNLFMATWESGFRSDLTLVDAEKIGRVLNEWSPILGVVALAVELLPAVALLHRRVAVAALVAVVGLHVVILASSGIFFWKWIACDLALLLLVWKRGVNLFARWPWWMRVAGVLVIWFGGTFFSPPMLAWWDTTVTRTFTWYAVDPKGQEREIGPKTFAPYAVPFFQDKLQAFDPEPVVSGVFGATYSRGLAQRLERATPSSVKRMHANRAARQNRRRADNYATFVAQVVGRRQAYGRKTPLWWVPSPPHHMWHGPQKGNAWRRRPVVSIVLRARVGVFHEGRLQIIRDEVIDEFSVSTQPGAKPTRLLKHRRPTPSQGMRVRPREIPKRGTKAERKAEAPGKATTAKAPKTDGKSELLSGPTKAAAASMDAESSSSSSSSPSSE